MSTDLSDIETATLGHFLEQGFMAPAIQGVIEGARVFGPALTVRLPGSDGTALVHALSTVQPGEVIIVDRCGDERHACWGAVLSAAARSRGVAGVIIDGYMTDRSAILDAGFPVWCRGRSPVTTKIRGNGGEIGATITCGGVRVDPGDIVLADESGVVVLDPATVGDHAARARAMQDAEPATIARLEAGETLAAITRPPALARGPATTGTP
ncbi:MAG: RraA family protein [Acuticoccus sp.]